MGGSLIEAAAGGSGFDLSLLSFLLSFDAFAEDENSRICVFLKSLVMINWLNLSKDDDDDDDDNTFVWITLKQEGRHLML